MKVTILRLGRQGPPSKHSDGYFRFLCPARQRTASDREPQKQSGSLLCVRSEFQQYRPADRSRLRLPRCRRTSGAVVTNSLRSSHGANYLRRQCKSDSMPNRSHPSYSSDRCDVGPLRRSQTRSDGHLSPHLLQNSQQFGQQPQIRPRSLPS